MDCAAQLILSPVMSVRVPPPSAVQSVFCVVDVESQMENVVMAMLSASQPAESTAAVFFRRAGSALVLASHAAMDVAATCVDALEPFSE